MTADTSVVVASLTEGHPRFDEAKAAVNAIDRLPAHVVSECYSVLTRLPRGQAILAAEAAALLNERFPGDALTLTATAHGRLASTLAAADVYGGATYDGLIALEAAAHGEALLTLDHRARGTYARLGADVRVL